ncbi:hypothetical protein ACFC0S_16025 [Streptomyces sp. NPDC056084]|uniref:hypothetical protein n=1 Tax=unclassified Streptomyces TaxID=2593676 RepID=UPI0035DC7B3C
MYQRLRAFLQGLIADVLGARPSLADPVHVLLTHDTDLDSDTRLEWDGTYIGRLHIGGVVLEGTADELARFAREAEIAAAMAAAAQYLDADRPGTLSPSGGEA